MLIYAVFTHLTERNCIKTLLVFEIFMLYCRERKKKLSSIYEEYLPKKVCTDWPPRKWKVYIRLQAW